MEDQEEVSDIESCRSSVISDLDELEANLYSCVHHERNESYEYEYSNLLPLEGEVKDFTTRSLDLIPSDDFVDEGLKSSGKETCSDSRSVRIEGGDIDLCETNRECNDSSKEAVSNELSDSKYNVGSEKGASLEKESSDSTVHVPETISGPEGKKDLGGYSSVEILSSSDDDDDATKSMSKNSSSKRKSKVQEVVILEDDSDSDIIIEFEKVTVKNKMRKKKKGKKIAMDIKLNTVRSKKMVFTDGSDSPNVNSVESVESVTIVSTEENPQQNRAPLCKSWTQAMVRFYDESWGGECINLHEVQKTMSDKGWELDISDEYSSVIENSQNRRYFGNKSKGWCTNCQRRGHFRNECPEEIRPPSCYRCGSANHTESYCNNTVCLTCGKETDYLVTACKSCRSRKRYGKKCSICNQIGHAIQCCPDIWRRFHATVVPGKIVYPKTRVYKESKNVYCCNCATRGHLAYQCKKNTFSDYVPLSPLVVSYKNPAKQYAQFDSIISRNWEKVGRTAPNSESNITPLQKKKEKRGKKRPRTSSFQGTSKLIKLSESAREYAGNMRTNGDMGISRKKSTNKSKKNVKSNLEKSGNLIRNKLNEQYLEKTQLDLSGNRIQMNEGNSVIEQQKSLEKNKLGSSSNISLINIDEGTVKNGINSTKKSARQTSTNLTQVKLDKSNSKNRKQSSEKNKSELSRRNVIPIELDKRNSSTNNWQNLEKNEILTSTPKPTKVNGKNINLPKSTKLNNSKAEEVRIDLSDAEFSKVTGVQGDEILKQLTRDVKGLAASPIDAPNSKSMLLIGTKKKTTLGKFLLRKLLRDFDTCATSNRPNVCTVGIQPIDTAVNGFYQQEFVEKTPNGTPTDVNCTPQDMRIEVNNISNSRNVSYLQEPEKNAPNSIIIQDQHCPNYSNNDVNLDHETDLTNFKRHVQTGARILLTKQEFSHEKLKPFAKWCLSTHNSDLSDIIKTHLKILSLDRHKNKSPNFFKKHLTVIATWRCNPRKKNKKKKKKLQEK